MGSRYIENCFVLVACLIMLGWSLAVIWGCAKFAFGYSNETQWTCYVLDASSYPVEAIPDDTPVSTHFTDVSGRFNWLCEAGFWIFSVQLISLLLANKLPTAKYGAIVTMFLHLVHFVLLNFFRFDYAGQVCSGDLLSLETDGTLGFPYLIHQGQFLKIMAIY